MFQLKWIKLPRTRCVSILHSELFQTPWLVCRRQDGHVRADSVRQAGVHLLGAGTNTRTDRLTWHLQATPTNVIAEIQDADSVNHVVVFLTGAMPFPEGYGIT